jgi:hypothetical protein
LILVWVLVLREADKTARFRSGLEVYQKESFLRHKKIVNQVGRQDAPSSASHSLTPLDVQFLT